MVELHVIIEKLSLLLIVSLCSCSSGGAVITGFTVKVMGSFSGREDHSGELRLQYVYTTMTHGFL